MRVIDQFPNVVDVGDKEVGIEIEMEGRRTRGGYVHAPLNYWRLDHDGSLRGAESCEYILAAPITRDKVPLALRQLKDYLKAQEAIIDKSDRAGVHVHLNVQKVEIDKVFNFILLYTVFEDILVRYCGDNREGNLFCLRTRDADSMMIELVRAKRKDSFAELQHDHFRYASINVTALSKYGSLEFRSLETPQDLNEINQWVNLLLAFKDHALNNITSSNEIVENISKNGELLYLKQILNNDELYKALVKGKDTAEMIRQGVRRVQHICYTKKDAPKKMAGFAEVKGRLPDLEEMFKPVREEAPDEFRNAAPPRRRARPPQPVPIIEEDE